MTPCIVMSFASIDVYVQYKNIKSKKAEKR